MIKGIDVSEHQGIIDWDKVKSQIDYAIIRIGYGDNITSQDDKYFVRNANECTRLGIPFGVYIYSYATSIAQAQSEAEHVLRLIQNYKLDYPVYYDLEDANTTGKCSNKSIADMAETFANIIEGAGYWCGMYANTSWWNSKLTDSRFGSWVKWVAQYASSCSYDGSYDMWQYASDGRVNGIGGNVDMNYCYVDYPTMINNNQETKSEFPLPLKMSETAMTYGGELTTFKVGDKLTAMGENEFSYIVAIDEIITFIERNFVKEIGSAEYPYQNRKELEVIAEPCRAWKYEVRAYNTGDYITAKDKIVDYFWLNIDGVSAYIRKDACVSR